MELWKIISDFPTYSISNNGEIKNNITGLILKGRYCKQGYRYVILYNKQSKKAFKHHRLVGKYFISNPNNLPEINHKDGIKSNNHYLNLEWCTRIKNIQHSWEKELRKGQFGESNSMYGKKGLLSPHFGKTNKCRRGLKFNAKRVINTVTGQTYDCATDAADSINMKASSLRSMLNGTRLNKTQLKYLEDYGIKRQDNTPGNGEGEHSDNTVGPEVTES